jgi:hypothetical protein
MSAARRLEGNRRETQPATPARPDRSQPRLPSSTLVWQGQDSNLCRQCRRFTGRTAVSPRVPSHPHLAPTIACDVYKRPADSFGRPSASPPVPARPARLGVGRREGGGKSPPTHGRVPYRRGQGQAYESLSLHAWISCSVPRPTPWVRGAARSKGGSVPSPRRTAPRRFRARGPGTAPQPGGPGSGRAVRNAVSMAAGRTTCSSSGEAAAGRVRPARPGRPSPPAAGSPDAPAPGPRGAT